jgi:hypothetical protein
LITVTSEVRAPVYLEYRNRKHPEQQAEQEGDRTMRGKLVVLVIVGWITLTFLYRLIASASW